MRNEEIAPQVFILTIHDKKIASTAKPGQFVNIRVRDSYFPLLRRPFSVHSVGGDTASGDDHFKILYKVVGEGTKILSTYKRGDKLDVIGLLGNHFVHAGYKNFLLIAGGMGVAPLYFLATQIPSDSNLITLIGAKTKDEVLCDPLFARLGKVMVATEDGSYGMQGVVTDLLKVVSPATAGSRRKRDTTGTVDRPEIIFACGPLGMLKTIKSYAKSHSIPCQLALEQHMACGMGVCLGCAIPVKHGYKYVCKDGPVFLADEIEI